MRVLKSAQIVSLISTVVIAVFSGRASLAAETAANGNAVKLTQGKGKLVSFENGTLTVEGPSGKLVWNNITDQTPLFLSSGEDNGPDRGYKPAPTLETLRQTKPGTYLFVGTWFGYQQRHGIFVGIGRGSSVGTFVSFTTGGKNSGLSLLAKDQTPGSFSKKYGNSLFIRNIPDNTPVEESLDGGPFQVIGTAKTELEKVKEGTLVTVYFLGEGNVTLIQLGAPKTK